MTSLTDAENHTTSYTYASFFGLTKTTYLDTEYEEYQYDDAGTIASFTDCKGNETTFTYDKMMERRQSQSDGHGPPGSGASGEHHSPPGTEVT